MKIAASKFVPFLITGALCALGLEGILRVWASASSPVAAVLKVQRESSSRPFLPDSRLGIRPNPEYPGHDSRGFRNALALERADIVVLGDSQTYGSGVEREQAWPERLAQLSGLRVYNMAYPSYGPAHHLMLLEEALALSPQLVIATLYAGNDLFDCFQLAYCGESAPELRNSEASVVDRVLDLESTIPLVSDIESAEGDDGSLRAFLSKNSRLVGVLRSMRDTWRGTAWDRSLAGAKLNPDRYACFERGTLRTVMTPSYRKIALNLDDARIHEGLRIAHNSMSAIARRCAESGTAFAVVLIPTKEYVFSTQFSKVEELGTVYGELIGLEGRMWEQTESFLTQEGIESIYALTALSSPLDLGIATYRESSDGHPNPRGQSCIAEAVQEVIAHAYPGMTPALGD